MPKDEANANIMQAAAIDNNVDQCSNRKKRCFIGPSFFLKKNARQLLLDGQYK